MENPCPSVVGLEEDVSVTLFRSAAGVGCNGSCNLEPLEEAAPLTKLLPAGDVEGSSAAVPFSFTAGNGSRVAEGAGSDPGLAVSGVFRSSTERAGGISEASAFSLFLRLNGPRFDEDFLRSGDAA